MRRALIGVLVGLALATTACGGGTSGRPSVDAISTALRSKDLGSALGGGGGSVGKATADCFAKVVHDSRVSNLGLRQLLRGETNLSKTDQTALLAVVPQLQKCKTTLTSP